MAFVVGTVIALLFLDGLLRVAVIAAVALIELAEIAIWLKWRKVRSTTGVESLVGSNGVAITDCDPDGQVKVKGQIWKARAEDRVAAGDAVQVLAVEGLRLDIAPR